MTGRIQDVNVSGFELKKPLDVMVKNGPEDPVLATGYMYVLNDPDDPLYVTSDPTHPMPVEVFGHPVMVQIINDPKIPVPVAFVPTANTVGIDTARNTIRVDPGQLPLPVNINPTANAPYPTVQARIDTDANTVKLDPASKLHVYFNDDPYVAINPSFNTVKLTGNPYVAISPDYNTVKVAPGSTDDSVVGSGSAIAPTRGTVIASVSIGVGYWEITAKASVSGVFSDGGDNLGMQLSVGSYLMGHVLVPGLMRNHQSDPPTRVEVPAGVGTHTVRFKSTGTYVVNVTCDITGGIGNTNYHATIVATKIG